jgi:hypothetical protein
MQQLSQKTRKTLFLGQSILNQDVAAWCHPVGEGAAAINFWAAHLRLGQLSRARGAAATGQEPSGAAPRLEGPHRTCLLRMCNESPLAASIGGPIRLRYARSRLMLELAAGANPALDDEISPKAERARKQVRPQCFRRRMVAGRMRRYQCDHVLGLQNVLGNRIRDGL